MRGVAGRGAHRRLLDLDRAVRLVVGDDGLARPRRLRSKLWRHHAATIW